MLQFFMSFMGYLIAVRFLPTLTGQLIQLIEEDPFDTLNNLRRNNIQPWSFPPAELSPKRYSTVQLVIVLRLRSRSKCQGLS